MDETSIRLSVSGWESTGWEAWLIFTIVFVAPWAFGMTVLVFDLIIPLFRRR